MNSNPYVAQERDNSVQAIKARYMRANLGAIAAGDRVVFEALMDIPYLLKLLDATQARRTEHEEEVK